MSISELRWLGIDVYDDEPLPDDDDVSYDIDNPNFD